MAVDRLVHVVDDEESIRRSLEFLLKTAGFQVQKWPDGEAFLKGADRAAPACVLLDVRMPGMDGLQVQAEMAQRGLNLPVIVLTGHGDVGTAVRAMRDDQQPVQVRWLLDAEVAASLTLTPDDVEREQRWMPVIIAVPAHAEAIALRVELLGAENDAAWITPGYVAPAPGTR